jgi:predicted amidohydrolase YtcJ
MTSSRLVLYRNGSVYSAADPLATAMLVDGDTIAWVGSEHAAESISDGSMRVVDLRGALVAPGFIDSHLHVTETGLALESLDLSATASLAELLAMVERAAAGTSGMILGHGWNEAVWPEVRAPFAAELDAASGGREVYLTRADVHSAAVSGALAASLGLAGLEGWDNGSVAGAAHKAARSASRRLDAARRTGLQGAALKHAASRGIVAVVEMGAAHIAPEEDLRLLLGLDGPRPEQSLPEVLGYWGEAVGSAAAAREVMARFEGRLAGLGGDLNVDGSLGSRTAALRRPYSDAAHISGEAVLDIEQVAAHLAGSTEAGVQAAFHVIGDAGLDLLLAGAAEAAARVGIESFRAGRHRLEHVEMTDDDAVAGLLHYGFTASMQPAFDALWGGSTRLYGRRLGPERAAGMNRIGTFLSAGVPVCLGSDSPVTALDPWASVRACIEHSSPRERISARAAFIAHTRAGWRAAGTQDPMMGQLVPGSPASYAVWRAEELMVQTPDHRVQSWSTDPRARTPLLPALDTETAPHCLQTVHRGQQLYAAADLGQ